ncbi:hypothetical protein JTB14_021143 [Gonioctena quinquepunctata]|nr:hypothetical protein JTB14_021143 [Gonioctena quinquepunctata]
MAPKQQQQPIRYIDAPPPTESAWTKKRGPERELPRGQGQEPPREHSEQRRQEPPPGQHRIRQMVGTPPLPITPPPQNSKHNQAESQFRANNPTQNNNIIGDLFERVDTIGQLIDIPRIIHLFDELISTERKLLERVQYLPRPSHKYSIQDAEAEIRRPGDQQHQPGGQIDSDASLGPRPRGLRRKTIKKHPFPSPKLLQTSENLPDAFQNYLDRTPLSIRQDPLHIPTKPARTKTPEKGHETQETPQNTKLKKPHQNPENTYKIKDQKLKVSNKTRQK